MSSQATVLQEPLSVKWIMPDVASGLSDRGSVSASRLHTSSVNFPQIWVDLPYSDTALEPYLSAKTIRRHCGAHTALYATEVALSVAGTAYVGHSLEDIIKGAALRNDPKLVRAACHVHNHQLYWNSMKSGGGGVPQGRLLAAIVATFGSWDDFCSVFRSRAANRLWAGWLWLVQDGSRVVLTHATDGSSPLLEGKNPLLALDLWEFAYHIDYGSSREQYVEAFLQHLVDWQGAERRLL